MAIHFFLKAIWLTNHEGLPIMNKPVCGQHTERIGVGGATTKREEVTCQKCLASLNKTPKAPKQSKSKAVKIESTFRSFDGKHCVSASQGDKELSWNLVDDAEAEISRLLESYPEAKVTRF